MSLPVMKIGAYVMFSLRQEVDVRTCPFFSDPVVAHLNISSLEARSSTFRFSLSPDLCMRSHLTSLRVEGGEGEAGTRRQEVSGGSAPNVLVGGICHHSCEGRGGRWRPKVHTTSRLAMGAMEPFPRWKCPFRYGRHVAFPPVEVSVSLWAPWSLSPGGSVRFAMGAMEPFPRWKCTFRYGRHGAFPPVEVSVSLWAPWSLSPGGSVRFAMGAMEPFPRWKCPFRYGHHGAFPPVEVSVSRKWGTKWLFEGFHTSHLWQRVSPWRRVKEAFFYEGIFNI